MTTKNYSGRKIDLSLFPEKTGDVPATMGLRPSPLVITGKLKASQNYVRVLLSEAGEKKEDPEFGTSLMSDFKSSNISFPIQIEQKFSSQNLLVLKWLKERYNEETPLDERINRVELENYSVMPGGQIILDIQLYTEAGEKSDIHLPIKWQK